MPAQPAFPPSHTSPFPALYLYPLNDSFVPKHISLVGGQRVKIGRQTNAKTVPGERNGYFDSKVLSRQHAEVWEEAGKIYIKDVKSSNGTFINGERLSAEGVESEPYELKTDDIVEFGIDIVGEDNKTIIHHKVAARVTCIFTAEEALSTQREAYNFQQQTQQTGPAATLGATQRRASSIQPPTNGVGIMGGMGGGSRQPGRSGLSFEHIMNKLQSELSKSRETSHELGQVAGTMGEIENVLSGSQPPNLPPYPQLPPVRPPQQPSSQVQLQSHDSESSTSALQTLQAKLAETQATLASHVEKVRTLETLLSDHDAIRREVNNLRELIEEQREHQRAAAQHIREDEDDDDRRSINTITPHELESVPEEDETEIEESEEERHARREELGRPRTPEPSSLGMREEDEDREHQQAPSQPPELSDELTRRLTLVSDQLESALELSRNLMAQHAAAQQTIESLENKVSTLEELVAQSIAAKADEDVKAAELVAQRAQEQQNDMVSLFAEFTRTIEERWEGVKTDWEAERERMEKARGEWEARAKGLEEGVSGTASKFEIGIASLAAQLANMKTNGYRDLTANGPVKHKGGLVTPPSPRSLSDADSDSDQSNTENGPKGSGGRRSRSHSRSRRVRISRASRSRSPATSASASTTLVDGMSIAGSQAGTDSSVGSVHSRRSSADSPVAMSTTDVDSLAASPNKARFPRFLPTPGASIHEDIPLTTKSTQEVQPSVTNGQIALGIFVFGFATAAVLWRVKE